MKTSENIYQTLAGSVAKEGWERLRQEHDAWRNEQLRRGGPKAKSPNDLLLYISGSIKVTDEGCWEWARASRRGYGVFNWCGKPRELHRFMFCLTQPKTLSNLDLVCHTCDHKRCIRPDHLYLGDCATNNEDRRLKERAVTSRAYKLTEREVKRIIELGQAGILSNRLISKMFNVTHSNVADILKRRTWKYL